MFPAVRPRRLRRSSALRGLVRETRLTPESLIYPLFVRHGEGIRNEIPSMPGQYHFSPDSLVDEVGAAHQEGVRAVLLFGLPESKDAEGSESWSATGAVQLAVAKLKQNFNDLVVATDVCLCEYTDHGHCGLIAGGAAAATGEVDNDRTLPLLARSAVSHAKAGADLIAPSDMMDGRIGALRDALDAEGFESTPILSYAAKYASAYYGPFREAADSAPQFGDRRSYQMDPANADEALREVALDLDEGADIVMVKPALAYLDVIRRVRERFEVPIAAYNVSGEYSMLVAAAERGWIDRERTVLETLTSIRRAGADMILTYHAREAARLLNG